MISMYIVVFCLLFLYGVIFMYFGLVFLMKNYMLFMDWEILSLNSFTISGSVILDYMSCMFMGCVFLISSMVILYSYIYMSYDVYNYRFLMLVFMFILSMMFMIISPNMISILLGWDGLGLTSYALVMYFQNYNSYNAGMLTILMNRIGDVAILMSISWMLNFGGWGYIYYMYMYSFYMKNIMYFIVLASFTKSAQIPFSSWLPAAMAAPTPVSALVHSSTLVTAGVYLMIRVSPMLYSINYDLFILISMLTMFMSGLGANFEFDLKKIIALSTLSQLGLMMFILFMGFPNLAFFHLLMHAFFKALLFLCAGLIIHVMNDSQDIRDMGFITSMLPYTSASFFISIFSLSGMPFLSGFYSKDLILEVFSMMNINMVYYLIFIFSVGLTMAYNFRLMNYLMFKGVKVYSLQYFNESIVMMISMLMLVFMSIFAGSMFMWLGKTPFVIILPFYLKLMPMMFIFLGALLGYKISMNNYDGVRHYLWGMLGFMGFMWFMPILSTQAVYFYFLPLGKKYINMIDFGWGEYFFSKSFNFFMYMISGINFIIENNNFKLFMITFIFLYIGFLL
uniref:NADH-ubiquinone oxidoreductase chain 5 n=1 Tax=Mystilus priamus TaxID=2813419 RepID=A0A8T9ZXY6_9HEMI|nr:NADH dehydrogenase subunit 5 [Mystilus priamus]